jgi:hypothetical protein
VIRHPQVRHGSVCSNPHSALGQLAPDQFRQLSQPETGQPANLRVVNSAG